MNEQSFLLLNVCTRLLPPKFLGNNVMLSLHLSHKDERDMPEYECGNDFSLQSGKSEYDSGE